MIDAEQKEYTKTLSGQAILSFISSLDEKVTWNTPKKILKGFDGLIIGGSGEFFLDGGKADDDPAKLGGQSIIERLSPLINYLLQKDFPTMGICFGHQLIAHTQGGAVTHDHLQKKIGTHLLHLNEDGRKDRVMGFLPEHFNAQYGHHDSVTILPHEATLLAVGERCHFSALRYRKNIYSFQAHPELAREDVIRKLKSSPDYLPDGIDPETIVSDSPEASYLIPRFVDLVL